MLKAISMTCLLIFTLISCADSPDSSVAPNPDNNQQAITPEAETVIAMAVKYEGKDNDAKTCNFYVALVEEEHEDGDNHDHREEGHHLLMKVDYSIHGHSPSAGEGKFLKYNESTNVYYDEDSNEPSTIPVLLSLSLKESSEEELNPNSLRQYEEEGLLKQYLRIEFKDSTDPHNFIENLEAVVEDEAELTNKLDVLDSVSFLNMKVVHHDHYDGATCKNYKPVGVEEVDFVLDGHDEDNHDHDHD